MALSTTTTTYGRAAYQAMCDVVRDAKRDDPLAPVTLLVPSEQVGVTARRFLARGLTPDRPGIAGLTILTLRRLGELLAGRALAERGRRPLTEPVLAAAIRSVLADEPGLFEPVRDHTGTVRAIAQAHRELRDLDPVRLATLLGHSSLTDDVLRLHRLVTARTEQDWFDADHLTQAATGRLQVDARATEPLGLAVGLLLQDLDIHERHLLEALAEATDVHLVVAVTGNKRADAGPLRSAGISPTDAIKHEELVGHRVLHATDPDDEVRCVVREIVSALRTGTPGHRIAVLYGSADPYARLLHEHLATAEVLIHGRGVRPTAERLLGRAILRLLDLPDHRYRRDEVLGLLADAPIRWDGERAPSTAWERASRDAGVVADRDWDRLLTTATDLRNRAEAERSTRGEPPREWLIERNERQANAAESLHDFVNDVRSRLDRLAAATTWTDAAALLKDLWVTVLNGDDTARFSPEERRAADRVASVVDGLPSLDTLRSVGPPSLEGVREVVELQLAEDLDRVGAIGRGVHVGPISDAIGLDVDLVIVVGLAEGLLPGRHGEDPLLPDELRHLTDGALPTLRERLDRQHRHVLAALAGGQRTLLTFPRGDLRRGGERVPSRWLLPTLRRLTGHDRLQASDWQRACAGVQTVIEVPSHAAGLESAVVQVTAQEWRQRALLAKAMDEDDDTQLRASLTLRRGRRSGEFTRFDGSLAGVADLPDPRQQPAISPTALEAWTTCPHHYFVAYVLGVAPVETPEALVRIDARDRGTLVHEVLERFVEDDLDRSPGDPWNDRDAKRLDEIADEVFASAEAKGITGYQRLWEWDREAIRADLHAWLSEDNRRRAILQATPAATELPFGVGGESAVELHLEDGTVIRLKGKADRLDRLADGSLLVVDYKTGQKRYWPQLTSDDPTLCGTRLQLPIYALAARQHEGRPDAPVRAEYWFVNRRSQFGTVGFEVDDAVLDELRRVVHAIADGMATGVFIGRPRGGKGWPCDTCEAYGRTETDINHAWQAKLDDPALAGYLELIQPQGQED